MPTYQYICTECEHSFELNQSFTDSTVPTCPECKGIVRKVFSSVGVVFKGSGFYRTDSRGAATSSSAPGATAAAGAGMVSAVIPAGDTKPLIQGEVRVSPEVQSQIAAGSTLFVYAMAEEGSRRPVAIWRGTPTSWPVRFALSDSMGMGAPPVLSSLAQVRLVARISKTGSAQKQEGDLQVELPGVKTGVQGVVLQISGR